MAERKRWYDSTMLLQVAVCLSCCIEAEEDGGYALW